jgi:subtilase family serine protease
MTYRVELAKTEATAGGILPEFSKFDCLPGSAGGTPISLEALCCRGRGNVMPKKIEMFLVSSCTPNSRRDFAITPPKSAEEEVLDHPLYFQPPSIRRFFTTRRSLRLRLLTLAAIGILAGTLGIAQEATPAALPRITQAVDDTVLTRLKGTAHPLARQEFDQGVVSGSTTLTHVKLVLQRSAQQEAALEAYLASVQQPNSPNYHKWLTPEQFGALYGPADADIQKLTSWLESHGFTVSSVPKGRTVIDFSGTVAQTSDAFHVEIHSFDANGKQFYANTADPQIPAAFAPLVSGVANLNTDRPKPLNVPGRGGHYDPSLQRFVPQDGGASAGGSRLRPNYTTSGNPPELYVTPADAAIIYDTPNQTLNANFSGSSSYDGTGVTIGIAGQSNIDTSIVSNYRQLFLGDTTDITKVLTVSDPDSVGDAGLSQSGEIYLDTELSGGLAPGASIHLYVAANVDDAAQQAINENQVAVLSVSYGACELIEGSSGNQLINSLWQQATAQGITVFVSAGDEGSGGCDLNTNPVAIKGQNVNGLASTPYNIAVGGTDYYVLPSDFSTYASVQNAKYYGSAKSYIPESTWNDSTEIGKNTVLAQNVPWPLPAVSGQLRPASLFAGSGGASDCGVWDSNGKCNGYPKPAWQTGTGVPNDGVRDLPDVSLLAATGLNDATWLVCDESLASDGTPQNCATQSSGNFLFNGSGGTSASAPALAGIFALIVQKTSQRQGQAAATLYSLFDGSNGQKIFHDVTVGNIAVPCYQGTSNCTLNAAGNYYLSGYDTGPGYDSATGLGSVDATALIGNWPAPGSSSTLPAATTVPTVTVALSSATITPADSVVLTATVAGPSGSPTPTGSVTFSITGPNVANGTTAVTGTATLNSGSASFTVPANTLNVGTATIVATYTPDMASSATYFSGAAPSASLSVLQGIFTVSGSAVTISGAPATGTSTITVTASDGFATAGTVDLSCTLVGMPANAKSAYYPTCALAGSSVQVSKSTPGTVTATFSTTTTPTSALLHDGPNPFGSPWWNTGGATLACALLLVPPRRHPAWKSFLAIFAALVVLSGAGCGGGSGNRTTPGTYTFTIVGTLENSPASAPVAAGVTVIVK